MSEDLKQAATKAATEVGEFLMENIDKIDSNLIKRNPDSSLTTDIDKASEEKIIKILRSSFPDHAFLGEELGSRKSNSEYKWIIDPIDGTGSYIAKRDTFSISIGLEYQGEIILGVIYLPKLDELFVAEKGKGATLNNKPIRINNTNDLSKAIINYATYPGYEKETQHLDQSLVSAIPNMQRFGFKKGDRIDPIFGTGTMAAEFCYLACGRLDGLMRFKQKPWDVAAGSLIASEAGAKLVNLKGKATSVYEGDYIAGDPELVEQILKVI